jgi:hypothetical protein
MEFDSLSHKDCGGVAMTSVNPALLLGGAALSAASVGFTILQIREGLVMEGQHWVMLLIVLVVGYVLGRIWTQPAQMVGLP